MDYILVDTNIVSYLMKDHPIARLYHRHLQGRILCLSFITIGELYLGAEINQWGEVRRKRLEEVLRNYVILPYDKKVAEYYAKVIIGVRKKGYQISFSDAWIAATAIAFDLPFVTHNKSHFEHVPNLIFITEIS